MKINFNWRKVPNSVYLFIICFIVFCLSESAFYCKMNISNFFLHSSILIIVTLGMTLAIISGGFDLSIGANLTLCGVIAGKLLGNGSPIWIAIICALFFGICIGSLNGFMITKISISPFITTFGMMGVATGLSNLFSNSRTIYWDEQPLIEFIGTNQFLFIPIMSVIAIIISIILAILFYRTKLGTYLCAIGGNEDVAELVGISVIRWKQFVYTLCGFFGGLSGILMISRMQCADPIVGVGYEFEAVVAAVIGGASLSGGKGNILGSVMGAIVIVMMKNGLSLMGFQTAWQRVFIGIILILGMIMDKVKEY